MDDNDIFGAVRSPAAHTLGGGGSVVVYNSIKIEKL